jgi:hypothetical protein
MFPLFPFFWNIIEDLNVFKFYEIAFEQFRRVTSENDKNIKLKQSNKF